MDMNGKELIPQPKAEVWAALNDVDVLKRCIPGCDELEWNGENKLLAKVTLKVGPMKASFKGNLELSDIRPPDGYTISGEGSAGAVGSGKGGATVVLEETEEGTLLSYAVHSQVSGKIAQLGSRLIDATAAKLAGEFFGRLNAIVSERGGEASGSRENGVRPEVA